MKLDLEQIGGDGGGKAGGSSSAGTEYPNTLRSKAVARFIELLGEGPILGLVDGGKSIFINKVPYENPDDSENFKGVSWAVNTGESDQEALPGFDGVKTEYEVGIKVRNDTPVTYRTAGTGLDAIVVTLMTPSMTKLDKENGSMGGTSVEIAIDIKSLSSPGNTWVVDKIKDVISGKQTGPYERSYRIQLDAEDGGPWLIKMRRITADFDEDSSTQNLTYFGRTTEIYEYKVAYSDSAHVGIEVDAEQFNGSADRAYDVYGKLINYPSNYNPTTRAYTGIWDGTYSFGYCNNPAWVFEDICCNPRYGLGIPAAFIDKWALYSLAQYCDELVPDGLGGTEPRFEFNGTLYKGEDAFKVLQQIASLMRAIVFYGAGAVLVRHDAPKEVTRTYSPANTIGVFSYASTAKSVRHNACVVKWTNPELGHEDDYEIYEDRASIIKHGRNLARIEGFATKGRGQAHRQAKWLVLTEQLQAETVTFTAGMDSGDVLPGDLVNIADPHWATADFAGRVKQYVGNANIIPVTTLAGIAASLGTLDNVIIDDERVEIPAMTTFTASVSGSTLVRGGWSSNTAIVSGDLYTASGFVHIDSTIYPRLRVPNVGDAVFNLETLEVVFKTASVTVAGIENHGDGVYRIWLHGQATATGNTNVILGPWNGRQLPFSEDGTLLAHTTDGTESLSFGGFMLEEKTDGTYSPNRFNPGTTTGTQVILDRPIDYIPGSTLGLTLLEGEYDDIVTVANNEDRPARRMVQYFSSSITAYDAFSRRVTLADTLTTAQNDKFTPIIWVYSSSEMAPKPFVVVDNDPDDNEISYKITALEYSVDKFNLLDEGFNLEDPLPYSNLPNAGTCPPPTHLRITQITETLQGSPALGFSVSWRAPVGYPYVTQYAVRYRRNNGNWVELPQVAYTSIEIDNLPAGGYQFEVLAVNIFGIKSRPVTGTAEIEESILPTRPRVTSFTSDIGDLTFKGQDLKLFWLSNGASQDVLTKSIFGRFDRSAIDVTSGVDGILVVGGADAGTNVAIEVDATNPAAVVITLSGTIAEYDSVTLTIGPTQFTYVAASSTLSATATGLAALIHADTRYSASAVGNAITLSFTDSATNATNIQAQNDPTFLRYRVEILDPADDTLLNTFYTVIPEFTYTYVQNVIDFGGSPSRDVKVSVYIELTSGTIIDPASETFSNDAPALIAATPSFTANSFLLTFPEVSPDADFAGYLMWMGDTPAFVVDDTSLVWRGRGAPIILTSPDTTKYYRYALFDAFGISGVNLSAEFMFTTDSAGDGYLSTLVNIYKRAAASPAVPSVTTTYHFDTGVLDDLNNGWTQAIPAGTEPLWTTVATAYGTGVTDTIATGEWATPVLADAGTVSAATVFLFKRTETDTPPAVPVGSLTYTFSTSLLSGSLDGWTQTMPVTGGNFRWMIFATALAAGATTDTIATGEWSTQSLMSADTLDVQVTKPHIRLPADKDNVIASYASAGGNVIVKTPGGTDVSASFTLSTSANPQALTVGYVGQAYSITAGFDAGEDVASLTILVTGTGNYAGLVFEKIITFAKYHPPVIQFVANANSENGLTPTAPVFTVQPAVSGTYDDGNVAIGATFTYTQSNDPDASNCIDSFETLTYVSATNETYAFDGSAPSKEIPGLRIAVKNGANSYAPNLGGGAPNLYYQFAVRAVRKVHTSVSASGYVYSAWAITSAPFRPSATFTTSGTLVISSVSGGTMAAAVTNFNGRNDRSAAAVTVPTILGDGTAVDHTLNASALSCDISFEWSWAGTETDIDGFQLMWVGRTASGAYTVGGTPGIETLTTVPPDRRAHFLYGVDPTLYYTFYVRAYRIVDPDVNAAGVILSAWVKPALAAENPYRPASSVAYAGDVSGTISGVSASTVATGITNFNNRNDQNATAVVAPTIVATGAAVDHTINTDASADISFEWVWGGTEADIDGFEVYYVSRTSSAAYTHDTTPSIEQHYYVPPNVRVFILSGVPANLYYTFYVRAYRTVDPNISGGGRLYSAFVKPSLAAENPYRPSANVAFLGDISGTVGYAPIMYGGDINVNVYANWAGSIVAGQLFKYQFKRYKGAVDVTASATWSATGTHTVSISAGLLTITGFASYDGYILVSSTYEGVTEERLLPVEALFGPPSPTDGSNVTVSTPFGASALSNTTYVTASSVLAVKTGALGDLTVRVYGGVAAEVTGSFTVGLKLQRRTGGGAWSDVATGGNTGATYDARYPVGQLVSLTHTDTTLVANTVYEFQVLVNRNAASTAATGRFYSKQFAGIGT